MTNMVEPKFYGLKNLFAVESYTLHTSATVAASGSLTKSMTISKSGYYPLSILSWSLSSSWFTVNRALLSNRASGSATLEFRLRSFSSNEITISSVIVYVLWIKE